MQTWAAPELTSVPLSATTTAEVVRVIDGDTIDVRYDGQTHRVRYIGIDTPEPYRDTQPECFSSEASAANRALVAGREVSLVADQENTDKYDRLLRYVYVDDVMVNAQLARGGYATTLSIKPNTRYTKRFSQAVAAARADGRGLWSACR